jgi:hypothetical protein
MSSTRATFKPKEGIMAGGTKLIIERRVWVNLLYNMASMVAQYPAQKRCMKMTVSCAAVSIGAPGFVERPIYSGLSVMYWWHKDCAAWVFGYCSRLRS